MSTLQLKRENIVILVGVALIVGFVVGRAGTKTDPSELGAGGSPMASLPAPAPAERAPFSSPR